MLLNLQHKNKISGIRTKYKQSKQKRKTTFIKKSETIIDVTIKNTKRKFNDMERENRIRTKKK